MIRSYAHGWRDDLFTDLLGVDPPSKRCLLPDGIGRPLGGSVSPLEGSAFHIIARGTCWLEVAGIAETDSVV